ncbi:MAG: Nif3-like dinuclear metal center hexameric protein, partial [Flavobacteriaceae bacterium]|nr:Nif3-like dinuclear metal center hexameric protein [Flavobacteriaceae bacterium]
MKVNDVIQLLEELAPQRYAEDFDNTGLLVGDSTAEVTGILVTLDTLEAVVDEAIEKECNLIVSFHPIIFSGLKKLTGSTYVERVVMKAIQHNIAIFAIHTALDNARNGVNDRICEQLGLKDRKILIPKKNTIKKLRTFVPKEATESVRNALFEAGAGSIGNYSDCSFNTEGTGTYKGNEQSDPVKGKKGERHYEPEIQIGVTFPIHLQSAIIGALHKVHPYEEVAYEITTLENKNQHIGMGMIGSLEEEMSEKDFLHHTKSHMNTECIRHSSLTGKGIRKVAVLGGSGSFAIDAAKAAGADAFISADFKYHDFFRAEGKILLTDIGHYESEQYTK